MTSHLLFFYPYIGPAAFDGKGGHIPINEHLIFFGLDFPHAENRTCSGTGLSPSRYTAWQ